MNFSVPRIIELLKKELQRWFEASVQLLPNLVVAIAVLILFYFLSRIVRFSLRKIIGKFSDNEAACRLIVAISGITIMVLGLFISLSLLELEKAVTSLLAGAGILGIVIGFAFQEISSNFLSGLIIAFGQSLKVGDIIKAKGYFGKVEKLDLRAAHIRTMYGLKAIIPNKYLITDPVLVYTDTDIRRVDLEVGVSYGDDLKKAHKLVEEAVEGLDGLHRDREPEVFVRSFGASSIDMLVRLWIEYPGDLNFFRVPHEAVIKIKESFDENDITIPFPIRTLDFGIVGGEKLSEQLESKSV